MTTKKLQSIPTPEAKAAAIIEQTTKTAGASKADVDGRTELGCTVIQQAKRQARQLYQETRDGEFLDAARIIGASLYTKKPAPALDTK